MSRRLLRLYPKCIHTPPNPNRQNEESSKGLRGNCCRIKHQLGGKDFQCVRVFPVGMVNQSFTVLDSGYNHNYRHLYCIKLC